VTRRRRTLLWLLRGLVLLGGLTAVAAIALSIRSSIADDTV